MVERRALTPAQARAFYDRLGARQDVQSFYEDRALAALIRYSRFEEVDSVLEFGCGTGRFAARLLSKVLPPGARYLRMDISETMVRIARGRLKAEHAEVMLSDGSVRLPAGKGEFARFVSTYVLDLLGKRDIAALLDEAHRILAADGRLCIVSLTFGKGLLSGIISSVWNAVYSLSPQLVGGCRPLHLTEFVRDDGWRVAHREVVSSFGVSSEVLVALPFIKPLE